MKTPMPSPAPLPPDPAICELLQKHTHKMSELTITPIFFGVYPGPATIIENAICAVPRQPGDCDNTSHQITTHQEDFFAHNVYTWFRKRRQVEPTYLALACRTSEVGGVHPTHVDLCICDRLGGAVAVFRAPLRACRCCFGKFEQITGFTKPHPMLQKIVDHFREEGRVYAREAVTRFSMN